MSEFICSQCKTPGIDSLLFVCPDCQESVTDLKDKLTSVAMQNEILRMAIARFMLPSVERGEFENAQAAVDNFCREQLDVDGLDVPPNILHYITIQ